MTKMHLAGIVGIAAVAAGCRCHAAEGASAWLYPQPTAVRAQAFAAKGLRLCDFHIHLRGGMSVEKGLARERASGIASAFIANHGRGWEIDTNLMHWGLTPSYAILPRPPSHADGESLVYYSSDESEAVF